MDAIDVKADRIRGHDIPGRRGPFAAWSHAGRDDFYRVNPPVPDPRAGSTPWLLDRAIASIGL